MKNTKQFIIYIILIVFIVELVLSLGITSLLYFKGVFTITLLDNQSLTINKDEYVNKTITSIDYIHKSLYRKYDSTREHCVNYEIIKYDAFTHNIYLKERYTPYYNIGIEEKYYYTYRYDRINSSILIFLNYSKEYKIIAPDVDYVISYKDLSDNKTYYALVWKSNKVKSFNISDIYATYIDDRYYPFVNWDEMKYSNVIECTEYKNNVKHYKVEKK